MTFTVTRRIVCLAGAAALAPSAARADATARLAAIERDLGGRIGVFGIDTASGRRVGYREAERFPMCSTFKLLAAALVLARVDRGQDALDRRVVFGRDTLVTYSPVTEPHAGTPDGMSVAEICRAAITRSDNTAGNLMLASFGGPAGLTAFLRTLGDDVSRLDRTEPTLNEALPDDPRDTTAPAAMASTVRRLVVGDTLSESSRRQLAEWLVANETGAARIRAACPDGWRVGDKTGTGERNAASDVAVIWPPSRAPLLLAIYTHGSTAASGPLNAAIAASARVALEALG